MFSSLFLTETAREGGKEENKGTQMSCIFPLVPLSQLDCAIKKTFLSLFLITWVKSWLCSFLTNTFVFFKRLLHVAESKYFRRLYFYVCIKQTNVLLQGAFRVLITSSLQFKSYSLQVTCNL